MKTTVPAAELATFAEKIGVPVFMNGAGRGCLPADHRLAFAQARGFALGGADVVLVLGAPLDFRLGYGRPPTFAEDAGAVIEPVGLVLSTRTLVTSAEMNVLPALSVVTTRRSYSPSATAVESQAIE